MADDAVERGSAWHRWLKRVMWLFLVCVVLGLAGLVAGLIFAPELGTWLTHKTLHSFGFEHVEAEMVALSPNGALITGIVLGDPERLITADRMIVRYRRNFLLTKRIEWIELHGLRLDLVQNAAGEWEVRGLDRFYSTDDEDSGWTIGELRAISSHLLIHTAGRRIPVPIEGTFTFNPDDTVHLRLALEVYECRSVVDARIASFDPLQADVSVELDDWQLAKLSPLVNDLPLTWLQGRLNGTIQLRQRADLPLQVDARIHARDLLLEAEVPDPWQPLTPTNVTLSWQAKALEVAGEWSESTGSVSLRASGGSQALSMRNDVGREIGRVSANRVSIGGATALLDPGGESLRLNAEVADLRTFAVLHGDGPSLQHAAELFTVRIEGSGNQQFRERLVLSGNRIEAADLVMEIAEITVAGESSLQADHFTLGQHSLTIQGYRGNYQNMAWHDASLTAEWTPGRLTLQGNLTELRDVRDQHAIVVGPLQVDLTANLEEEMPDVSGTVKLQQVSIDSPQMSLTSGPITLRPAWRDGEARAAMRVEANRLVLPAEGDQTVQLTTSAWELEAAWEPGSEQLRLHVAEAPFHVATEGLAFIASQLTADAVLTTSGQVESWSIESVISASAGDHAVSDLALSAEGTSRQATLSMASVAADSWTGATLQTTILTLAIPASSTQPWSVAFSSEVLIEPWLLAEAGLPLTGESAEAPIALHTTGTILLPNVHDMPDWQDATATCQFQLPRRHVALQHEDLAAEADMEVDLTIALTPRAITLSGKAAMTQLGAQAGTHAIDNASVDLQIETLRLPLAAGYAPVSIIPMRNVEWLRANLFAEGTLVTAASATGEDWEVEGVQLSLPLRWRPGEGMGEELIRGTFWTGAGRWRDLGIEPVALAIELQDHHLQSTGSIHLAERELSVTVAPSVQLVGRNLLRVAIPFTSTIASLATIEPLIAPLISDDLGQLSLSGRGSVFGTITYGRQGLGGQAELRVSGGGVSSPTADLTVTDLDLQVKLVSLFPLISESHQRLSFGPSILFGMPTNGGKLEFQLERDGTFFLESAEMHWLGGLLRSYAARIEPETTNVDITLWAENVELQQLLNLQDVVEGYASGQLYGKILLSLRNGRLMQTGGYLFNPPNQGGNVKLINAEALLSQLGRDDKRLAMARQALENLDYSLVRLDMVIDPDKEAEIVIKLHGTSVTNKSLPPVHLTTTITGPLRDLINAGLFFKSHGISLQ